MVRRYVIRLAFALVEYRTEGWTPSALRASGMAAVSETELVFDRLKISESSSLRRFTSSVVLLL